MTEGPGPLTDITDHHCDERGSRALRRDRTRLVGVLGFGSIGSVVARELAAGSIANASLVGIGVRPERGAGAHTTMRVEDLAQHCDLVVEAAGQQALAAHGAELLNAGCDVVALSVGALADDDVFTSLTTAAPGRLHLCTGAIGGVDLVRAVAALGPIHQASITSTKKPAGLVQPTMSDDEAAAVRAIDEPTVLFDGESRELVRSFPSSTNVAATLALAVGSWDVVRGVVRADPAAELTSHVIEVEGASGRYRFEMQHQPSPANPRSSAVVPWAVVRSLRDLCAQSWSFV